MTMHSSNNSRAKRLMAFTAATVLSASVLVAPINVTYANDPNPASVSAEFDRWAEYNETSNQRVDHAPFTSLLGAVTLQDRGREAVAYSQIDGQVLSFVKEYIRYLERVPVSELNKDEQLAYWLNLHNAGVLRMLGEDDKAPRRVKRFRGTPEDPGKEWTEKVFRVEGQELSLNDIEQNIIMRHWNDPLVIYGLHYGVQGSADIGKYGFTGGNVKTLLAKKAEAFVNTSRNVKVGKKGVDVSSLYEWHKETLFGGDDAAVISHLAKYAEPKLAKQLASASKIRKHRFSWKSNAYVPRSNNLPSFGGSSGGGGYSGGGGGS